MLNAILQRKTQGILRQDYTGEFTGYEDSLTATVFERLFYLSQLRLEAILDTLLKDSGLGGRAADLGAIQAYEFWPTWPAMEGGTKEPDVYVQFERADLIVEAKRWDIPQQYFDQWAGEIKARPPGHSGQRLLLLAIGGLSEYDGQHVLTLKRKALESEAFTHRGLQAADFDLLAASWRQFALIVQEQLKNPGLTTSDRFILRDILSGMVLHGLNTAEQRFFNQLYGDLKRLALEISDSAQVAFRPNSNKGYFDTTWLQRIAAFRPITLSHFKGA
jgi:hypothetical protein